MASPAPAPRSESRNSRRNTSLGFLRRSKSNDILGERKTSASRLGRKKRSEVDQEDEPIPQREGNSPPKLPVFPPQPQLQSFGGDNYLANMAAKESKEVAERGNRAPPVPPLPGSSGKETVDPYPRTESMTHRGRYSYANSTISTLNSPRRIRRRKDPTPFNVLVIGARNSGKTSFLNFLKTSLALPPKKQPHRDANVGTPPPSAKSNRNYIHHYQEIEVDNERIGLTIWDSQGLDKNVVDLQLREMSTFVESKFEDTFIEEMKVVRAPGVRDTHIHCVFFVLDPAHLDANIRNAQQSVSNGVSNGKFSKASRIIGGLDEDFDLQVLRTLKGKTTVVPVISKADTVTTSHMAFLKKTVHESLKKVGLDPLEALNFEDDDDDSDNLSKLGEHDKYGIKKDGEDGRDGSIESLGTPKSDGSDNFPDEQHSPNIKRQVSKKRYSSTLSQSGSLLDSVDIPLSILSPDSYSLSLSDGPIGRHFPWGFADPFNPEHCDFVKLKDACFGEWRAELREASREVFYERWRTSRLNRKTMIVNGGKNIPEPRKSSGGIPTGILKPMAR